MVGAGISSLAIVENELVGGEPRDGLLGEVGESISQKDI